MGFSQKTQKYFKLKNHKYFIVALIQLPLILILTKVEWAHLEVGESSHTYQHITDSKKQLSYI